MKVKIGLVLLLALVTAGIAIAMTSANANIEQDIKLPSELTQEELQELYKKYGITENDFKFAKRELPNYLKGTILDGSRVYIATENGKVPEKLKAKLEERGIDYIALTHKEMFAIMEEARKRYIAKYGVDPANPKIDVVDGVPLPVEYVKELVKNGKLKPEGETKERITAESSTCIGIKSNGPISIGRELYAWVVPADDMYHAPTESFYQDTKDTLHRFETTFGVTIHVSYIGGLWDASDVSNRYNASALLDDLSEDMSWIAVERNDIVIGWVDLADHNGMAYPDGVWYNWDGTWGKFSPYALCACRTFSGVDWPHDSIAQHETSHLFGADDHTSITPCIMDYWDAFWGVDVWCGDCYSCVNENIIGEL